MDVVIKEKERLLVEAAKEYSCCLDGYKGLNTLLLFSGGAALKLLDLIDDRFLDDKTTISVLDERYSTDRDVSNFLQIESTNFYQKAQGKGCAFIRTVPQDESLEEMAERFDRELKNWRKNNPDGKIIITQGMGPDGHTAGIMPFPEDPEKFKELFEEDENWVVGYDATGKNPFTQRVTTKINFLRDQVDYSLLYIVGEDKTSALNRVLEREGSLAETPALIIHQMKEVKLFTDIEISKIF